VLRSIHILFSPYQGFILEGKAQWRKNLKVLSTEQEMTPAGNRIFTHAQDLVVGEEFLVPTVKAFVHFPDLLRDTRSVGCTCLCRLEESVARISSSVLVPQFNL